MISFVDLFAVGNRAEKEERRSDKLPIVFLNRMPNIRAVFFALKHLALPVLQTFPLERPVGAVELQHQLAAKVQRSVESVMMVTRLPVAHSVAQKGLFERLEQIRHFLIRLRTPSLLRKDPPLLVGNRQAARHGYYLSPVLNSHVTHLVSSLSLLSSSPGGFTLEASAIAWWYSRWSRLSRTSL